MRITVAGARLNAVHQRIDTDALLAGVDLVALVGQRVPLKANGREFHGLCPFHNERSPSFTVNPSKGFYHCFGCGAHGDAIRWVMEWDDATFLDACERLGDRSRALAVSGASPKQRVAHQLDRQPVWVPLLPVPSEAPLLLASDRRTLPVWNPKRGRFWTLDYTRADAYLNASGELLGYVMRVEFGDAKVTPTVTWCVGPNGVEQWCVRPFPSPRPLQGLDALALRPHAPVIVVEGEKCRAAGAGAFTQYVVVTWPGGSKGIAHVDWAPLSGRDVVLWPDADAAGTQAMLGWTDRGGVVHRGVAQCAHRAGARSLRYIDTDGMPRGWDIADALSGDEPWSRVQLAAWARRRVVGIEVQTQQLRVSK